MIKPAFANAFTLIRNNFLWMAIFAAIMVAADLLLGERAQLTAILPQIFASYFIQRALLHGGEMRFSAMSGKQAFLGRYLLAWLLLGGIAILLGVLALVVMEVLISPFVQNLRSFQYVGMILTVGVGVTLLCAAFGPLFPAIVAGERFSLKTALNRSRGWRTALAFGLIIGTGGIMLLTILLAALVAGTGLVDLQSDSAARLALSLVVEFGGLVSTTLAAALFHAVWARRETDLPAVFA